MRVPDNKISSIIQFYKDELKNVYSENEISSFIFLAFEHYLGFSRTDLVLKKHERISESELLQLYFVVKQLKQHRPIQYILGETHFYGLTFKVNEDVLIPRPETEELVDWILNDLKEHQKAKIRIMDIGTGSGCIAIALKKKFPNAEVIGVDVSEKALEIARENARLNQVEIQTLKADIREVSWAEQFGTCDLIVSNPPYVLESEQFQMQENVLAHEPHQAIFVNDDDPLLFYKKIIEASPVLLKKNGCVYFEINEKMGPELKQLLEKKQFSQIQLKQDLSGKDRMVKGCW